MILRRVTYSEHSGQPNRWELHDLSLGQFNLIIGKNATGKTRVMNLLMNIAKEIRGDLPRLPHGNWTLDLEKNDRNCITFECEIAEGGSVMQEKLILNGKAVLTRRGDSAEIADLATGERHLLEPPRNKLTLHVRRDRKEHPYFEDLLDWAESYYAYMFSAAAANEVLIGPLGEQKDRLTSLMAVPYLLQDLRGESGQSQQILRDLKRVGYQLEKLDAKVVVQGGLPPTTLLELRERGLDFDLSQPHISAGMYRAVSTVIILNYLQSKHRPCTLAMDDIGEGLDFDRGANLIKLILEKTLRSQIQVILTSNDRHLLNGVDVRFWNVLERNKGVVRSYNYENSKEAFDDFSMTGLSNFDLLLGKMYKKSRVKAK
jgi:energy-coupling factor transporter ATP-binding protein EcfA2